MKTSTEYPPNYADITEALGNVDGAVFCYGDTIYNPFWRDITPDIELHESVHSRQQGAYPDVWYYKYLNDKGFRLEQELEAYAEQYAFTKRHMSGKLLDWGLDNMAQALSGIMYGDLLSFNEARTKIRLRAKSMV